MKWWPWSRKKKTVAITGDNDSFLKAIEITFGKVQWAESQLDTYIQVMDLHCWKNHTYLGECDLLCGPSSVFKLVVTAPKNDLEILAIVAMKYWYQCYVTLRDRDRQIES